MEILQERLKIRSKTVNRNTGPKQFPLGVALTVFDAGAHQERNGESITVNQSGCCTRERRPH